MTTDWVVHSRTVANKKFAVRFLPNRMQREHVCPQTEVLHMGTTAPIETIRQEVLAARGGIQCRICTREIQQEKRRGRPRLTCDLCAVFQAATAMVPYHPRICQQCGIEFRPARDVAKFCSDGCRLQAYNERRRSWTNQQCQGCGERITGRACKYCTKKCRRHRRMPTS